MRRSPWLSLVVCALVAAGCQRAGPAEPASASGSAGGGDIIEATPLTTDAPAPAAPAQTPAPKAEPEETAPTEDPQASIPEGPDMAPVRTPVSEVPCRDAIGASAAARLVERCIQVSPATHPPCNAANPCDLIQGEIDRSCKLWARDGNPPAECKS
ncbi:hypothetical protein SH203_02514 [Brevundimonas sp. SH203]|uniref:hypothetical protein n=1 Tax=Brevundimonas sp. SH203 TaxID=345167 RepID=UPI0009D1743C|nr:hypothetical protein [Brevundimonas sp. SH203]GAW42100.1 hypothetical protein SH203_02514 [Brevundimonas sp. SH203]